MGRKEKNTYYGSGVPLDPQIDLGRTRQQSAALLIQYQFIERQLSWPVDLIRFGTAELRNCAVEVLNHKSALNATLSDFIS